MDDVGNDVEAAEEQIEEDGEEGSPSGITGHEDQCQEYAYGSP